MRWANFLHIYQPAEQQPDILESIVAQSYRPILKDILAQKHLRLTFNVNGALLELFDKYNHKDLIDDLREVGDEDRVEFTSSAKYHAFLPFLEDNEIIRQIKINDETNRFYLGKAYNPKGFFPPEMAYKEELAPIIESLGFKWIILDEIACHGEPGRVSWSKIYKIKNSKLLVFFRERRLSNLIMSAVVRSEETLREAMREDLKSNRYVITAMDGETFGHHRPGLEKMLFDVWAAKDFELIKISDLPKFYQEGEEVSPVKSTWASSKEDIEKGIQFLSWSDPENAIHKWQWELAKLVLAEVYALDPKHSRYELVRKKMDVALSSDHFWWASAKPWWSMEMVEDGAYRLLDTIRNIPDVTKEKLAHAADLYEKIVSTGFNWQRTGKIREMMKEQRSILRIPFKDRTMGRGGEEKGVYYAFIDMMKKLEKEASKKGEYEKAILWRDAIFKLKNKLDIYDTINAIDLLRVEIPHEEVEKTIEEYKEKYRQIRGGQPEQRGAWYNINLAMNQIIYLLLSFIDIPLLLTAIFLGLFYYRKFLAVWNFVISVTLGIITSLLYYLQSGTPPLYLLVIIISGASFLTLIAFLSSSIIGHISKIKNIQEFFNRNTTSFKIVGLLIVQLLPILIVGILTAGAYASPIMTDVAELILNYAYIFIPAVYLLAFYWLYKKGKSLPPQEIAVSRGDWRYFWGLLGLWIISLVIQLLQRPTSF